jgi:hypothetical protein
MHRVGEEVAIPLVVVDEESREILQRVVDKTSMLVNLNIKVNMLMVKTSMLANLNIKVIMLMVL